MIGIIDSGCGGINVIKECVKYFKEDFIYLVDNKNCPYGNKNPEELKTIIYDNVYYLLNNYNIDTLIIGCNTASSLIRYDLLEQSNLPILKTYPDMKALSNKDGEKLLFATKNTIKNSLFVKYYLKNYEIKSLNIKNLPAFIDEKLSKNDKISQKKVENLLKKHIFGKSKYKNIKNVALGCTHFKHIEKEISDSFFNKINVLECEKKVAVICKYTVKSNKLKSSLRVILTKEDKDLFNFIQRQFMNI